jgi:acyl-coenzyme A thioesterase PaaI-like protein
MWPVSKSPSYETTMGAEEKPEVLALFVARTVHQGYPGRLHGGVATGVLDETIGRAINIGERGEMPTRWGVTAELAVRFHQPVPLEVELTARGRITRENRRIFEGTGELYLPDGAVAVSASGKYFKMTLDEIASVDPEMLGWQVYDELPPT